MHLTMYVALNEISNANLLNILLQAAIYILLSFRLNSQTGVIVTNSQLRYNTDVANIPSNVIKLHARRIRSRRSQTLDLCCEPTPFKRLVLWGIDSPAIDISQPTFVAVLDQW